MRHLRVFFIMQLASTVLCMLYSPGSTIPWKPRAPSSVDQSTVYNGTYYLADRSNNMVHVIELLSDQEKRPISGFVGQVYVKGKTDTSVSGPNGLIILPNRNEL